MGTYSVGMIAKSLAGHDKRKTYMIIQSDESYVYLVDGSIRTLQNPKKKKIKHVQVDYTIPCNIMKLLDASQEIHNSDVIRAIKEYNK